MNKKSKNRPQLLISPSEMATGESFLESLSKTDLEEATRLYADSNGKQREQFLSELESVSGECPWYDEIKSEEFTVEDGLGVINLIGDDFESIININGAPTAMNWDAGGGSIEQYLIHVDSSDYQLDLGQYRENVENGFSGAENLSDQIQTIALLLTPGDYELTLLEVKQWDLIYGGENPVAHFYPYGFEAIATRSLRSIDFDRVDEYKNKIREGVRPAAITISSRAGHCRYIIDGHHKLEAYLRLNINPVVLSIERQDEDVPDDAGFGVLSLNPLLEIYLKLKQYRAPR